MHTETEFLSVARDESLATLAVTGIVEHGDHLGRELGYPTANIYVAETGVLPDDGVYAVWFERSDGSVHAGAASIGRRTTVVRDGTRLLEVHVLDVDGWIDLYGEEVAVHFVDKVRDQITFDGLPQLVAQIGRDCDEVRLRLARR